VSQLPHQCPSCRGTIVIDRVSCPTCASRVEGVFPLPSLLRLAPGDIDFVEAFVKASGSLKEMANQHGQSYPTIRNRLNRIIAELSSVRTSSEIRRHSVLDAIARGELTVAQAVKELEEIE
jgi:hypothetical protein